MYRVLLVLCVVSLSAATLLADDTPAQPANNPTAQPANTPAAPAVSKPAGPPAAATPTQGTQVPGVQVKVDINYLTKYLDRMKLKYDVTPAKGFAHLIMVGDHAKFETYVIADTDSALAFIIIRNYLTVKPDHRNCDKLLRHLMELNWKLNVGKFEWNPKDGEVRLTFAFSTEEGIGYNAFKAVFDTLTNTADDKYEECQKILTSD